MDLQAANEFRLCHRSVDEPTAATLIEIGEETGLVPSGDAHPLAGGVSMAVPVLYPRTYLQAGAGVKLGKGFPSAMLAAALSAMDKQSLVAEIIARLDAELGRYAKAAQVAHAEATDEQSRAENKYDTRGLEASYLAHGQSRQVLETEQAREQFLALPVRSFELDESIGVGALVELENESERMWYFLGPAAGGTEVECEGQAVLVITPLSPLGRVLIGKCRGDQVVMDRTMYRTISVS